MIVGKGNVLLMPKVTIWIRNEDLPKWESIADRPEWLHSHLQVPYKIGVMSLESRPVPVPKPGALDADGYGWTDSAGNSI
jgi:hypothetical protein